MSLNELFTGYTHNSREVPYIGRGGSEDPSLNLKKPGSSNINQAAMPKETPNPPNTSNKNPVFGADWNEHFRINMEKMRWIE